MKAYLAQKKKLLDSTKTNIKPLKMVSDVMLPEIKNSNGKTIFKETLRSTLKLKKPLTFINDIISAELNLISLKKIDSRNFEVKISNQGSSPCYNAKCVLFKHEASGLIKNGVSEKFTIGIDEEKIIRISTKVDITGVYYAVVHDPIMDSFPFASINDLVKNQLESPALVNSTWTTHSPIGNPVVSNQKWESGNYFTFLQPTSSTNSAPNQPSLTIHNGTYYVSPFLDQSSEIQYKLTIPDFIKSSIKKDKISLRFGASLKKPNKNDISYNGRIILAINSISKDYRLDENFGNPSRRTLNSNNITVRIPDLFNRLHGKRNVFRETLPPNTNEINFFLQGINTSGNNSTASGHKHLLFSQINLFFEHRQMKQFPEILTT